MKVDIRDAKDRVVGAVLSTTAADHYHDTNPGDYGGLASAEMADDMLEEALAEYVAAVAA